MRVGIGCDHGGIVLKDAVINAVLDLGYDYIDYGTYSTDSVDYPDYAEKVSVAIQRGDIDLGILLCGTGIGISIAANKFKGIRCGHVTDIFSAQMIREHNNAQIMAMGGRISTNEDAFNFTKVFLTTKFAGGRHQNRIDKIAAIEERESKKII